MTNKKTVCTINAVEMWCLKRMSRISCMDRVTNEVLRRAGEKRSLCRNITKNQATFLRHVMRRQKSGTCGSHRKDQQKEKQRQAEQEDDSLS